MDIFTATMIAEVDYTAAGYPEGDEPSQETVVDAWQLLIDTGTCWRLQGWFGRTAAAMIDGGYCTLASEAA